MYTILYSYYILYYIILYILLFDYIHMYIVILLNIKSSLYIRIGFYVTCERIFNSI